MRSNKKAGYYYGWPAPRPRVRGRRYNEHLALRRAMKASRSRLRAKTRGRL